MAIHAPDGSEVVVTDYCGSDFACPASSSVVRVARKADGTRGTYRTDMLRADGEREVFDAVVAVSARPTRMPFGWDAIEAD